MYIHFLVLESITVAELLVILTGLSVRKKVVETASDTAYVFPGRPPVTGRGKENEACTCMVHVRKNVYLISIVTFQA